MKRCSLVLVWMLAGFWFTACQEQDTAPESIGESSDFESIVETAARYGVLTDSVTLGKCKGKLTEVAIEELAASVTEYISATYPSSEIKYAAKDQAGKIVVAIKLSDGTAKGLLFDANGAFVQELTHHKHKAMLTQIDVTTLPAAVTDYITSAYAGSEMKLAGTNEAGEYLVGIIVDDKVKILLFNADGTFAKELEKPFKRHRRR